MFPIFSFPFFYSETNHADSNSVYLTDRQRLPRNCVCGCWTDWHSRWSADQPVLCGQERRSGLPHHDTAPRSGIYPGAYPYGDSIVSLKETLEARGKHYEGPGGYRDTAGFAQEIKRLFRASPNWTMRRLSYAQMESLDMIANKLSRLLNGNPNHTDTWHDIAGYSTLAESDTLARIDAGMQV